MKKGKYYMFTLSLVITLLSARSQSCLIWANSLGGLNGTGTINSMDLSNESLAVVHNFGVSPSWDGMTPNGSLLLGQDGMLYSTTSNNFASCLYKYDLMNEIYDRLFVFSGSPSTGIIPKYNLIQTNDGMIYGTTESGGQFGGGTLFKYDTVNDTLIYVKSFGAVISDGISPNRITLTDDGKIYGTTNMGGIGGGLGTIFKYNPNNDSLEFVYTFQSSFGIFPKGGVTFAPNGKCYGTTSSGGANSQGTIFEFDTSTNIAIVKYNFNNTFGREPKSGLMLSSNGNLYGFTEIGGNNFKGVIYQFDYINSIYTKKFDFDGANGANPDGEIIEASNGNLYGLTRKGGINDFGVLFKIDTATFNYTKLDDFDGTDGKYPLFAKPLEVDKSSLDIFGVNILAERLPLFYPNPTTGIIYFDSNSKIPKEYFIADVTGSLIQKGNLLDNEINLSYLNSGVYFITIRSDSDLKTQRLVISK